MPEAPKARQVLVQGQEGACIWSRSPRGASLGSRSVPARQVRLGNKKRSRPSGVSWEQEGVSWEQEGAFWDQEAIPPARCILESRQVLH